MEYTTIGESCSVVSGGTPSRSKNEYWRNGTIPWMKIGNIKSKYVNEYDELITEQGLNNSSAKLLKKGTILYTIFATLGEVGILDIEACTNQAIAGININDPRITTDYLYYYLKSKKDYVNNIGRGVAQNNINLTTLKKFEIPLINVDKQLNIVEILEKVERMIDLKKKEIDDLDLLIKARFVEMFGDSVNNDKEWIRDSVERLCKEIYGGGTPSKSHPEYYEDGEIPWITSKDMKTDILIDSQIHINEDGVSNSTARIVPKNSVIMVIRSGILKHTLPVAINAVPITVNQDLKVFIPGNRIVTNFLAYQFKMMEREILSGVRAVTADNIEFDALKRRELIVPPIELQQQFADFVQQVDKSKFLCFHQKKIREIFKISRKLIFSLKFYSACRLWCEIKQYTFDTSNFMSNTLSNMNHNFMWNFSNSCCHNVNRACCTNNTAPFKSTFTIFNTSRLSCFFRKYFNEFSNNDFSLSFWICNAR